MKTLRSKMVARPPAFTLIELLVVMAIIGILAGLIIAGAGYAMRSSRINRARTELSQIETALESYKAQRGHYPPDNPNDPAVPPLFYELTGTLFNNGIYSRIHGGETIQQNDVKTVFGIGGFINSSPVANVNDASAVRDVEARDFLPKVAPGNYFNFQKSGATVALLGLPINSPIEMTAVNGMKFTPFRYVSTNPTNAHDTYDLWVELSLRGKTNRISNWNPDPEIVQ